MKITCQSYELPFKHPFRISKGSKTHQPTLVVSLEQFGMTGYGEAPSISYYNIPVEKMISDLEAKKNFIEKFAFTEPERYWHYLHHLLPENPFLVCALDIAAWDLYGKLKKQPIYKLWKLDMAHAPLTDYTIGLASPDEMIQKMNETPWPIYKIKLGSIQDAEIIQTIRKQTKAILRVDANAGWSLQEALHMLPLLADCGVELVEQPLAKDNWEGMKVLFERSPLPLIADESCVSEEDVANCHLHFHGINIKLTKCSGLTPALRMIRKARSLDMKVMVGSMNETTIGTAATAQLLPLLDYADMDGPLLLAEDTATGLSYENGQILLSGMPGLGINYLH